MKTPRDGKLQRQIGTLPYRQHILAFALPRFVHNSLHCARPEEQLGLAGLVLLHCNASSCDRHHHLLLPDLPASELLQQSGVRDGSVGSTTAVSAVDPRHAQGSRGYDRAWRGTDWRVLCSAVVMQCSAVQEQWRAGTGKHPPAI
jgi:hypothetical protein